MTLWQIDSGYFCAGLEAQGQRIVLAAPIIKWMIGKSIPDMRSYCAGRKWKMVEVRALIVS